MLSLSWIWQKWPLPAACPLDAEHFTSTKEVEDAVPTVPVKPDKRTSGAPRVGVWAVSLS